MVTAEIQHLPTGDPRKVRLQLDDHSFIDIYISATGRYSYHWDRIMTATTDIYRHDNAPHKAWRYIPIYPKHFHDGSEDNITAMGYTPENSYRCSEKDPCQETRFLAETWFLYPE